MKSKRISLTPERLSDVERLINSSIISFRLFQLRGGLEGYNKKGIDNQIINHFEELSKNILGCLKGESND